MFAVKFSLLFIGNSFNHVQKFYLNFVEIIIHFELFERIFLHLNTFLYYALDISIYIL